MNHTGLLVFVKYPEAGKVKTRLGLDLGFETSAILYRNLAKICIERYKKINFSDAVLFCEPSFDERFKLWLGENYSLNQPSGDLGERLKFGVKQILNQYSSCFALGTDSPDLPIEYLDEAIKQIQHHDVVIGPSEDGGYYLIGLSKSAPELFENINWSSNQVYSQTINKINQLNLSYYELPSWYDIDTYDELKRFLHNEDPLNQNDREQIHRLIEKVVIRD